MNPKLTNQATISMLGLVGGGEMGQRIRAMDWTQTPLGPIASWPQSLRTTVSILLNSRYPMFTFWGKDLINIYNDAYCPVLGKKHPAALGQSAPTIWAEIWADIGPLVEQVLTQGIATWADNLLLVMYRYGYVEETYFTFSYSPIHDESGGIGGLFCACTETTQQVLSERRLRTLRDLATRAGEAKTATAACHLAMQTLAQNPADIPFALLYWLDSDQPRAELAGLTNLEPGTPASPQEIDLTAPIAGDVWSLAPLLTGATVVQIDDLVACFGPLPGGLWEESPQIALVLPVASPGQDRPTAALVVGISPRRALDDDYQGFLQLVAGQLAAAIADARAYEVERQRAESLAAIDRAKTLFFSNISHEFRTPLTLMLAPLADTLADTELPLPSVHRDRLELVQRNSRRLLKLVNTLLDFSRIEAGRSQAVYEPTDLATLTTDLASTFRSLLERAGLTFIVDCDPLPEPVYVDPEMWEKIVLNLLSNAFKFTFSGTITVRLRAQGRQIELAIADTGIGISPAEIPFLFERFHRVKGAQGRSFEGSGIGLSLVQELVKLHGGTLTVNSTLGQGSCFTITLPLGTAHLPPDQWVADHPLTATALGALPYLGEARRWLPTPALPEEEVPWSEPEPAALSWDDRLLTPTAHILVVDDNADMRDYMQRLLAPYYRVTVAMDGQAALQAIQSQRPDLVLADVMMPRLDGLGLLQALRTDPTTRDLPIILLSARAGAEARIEGLTAGVDDYLIKPFAQRELLARVDACLRLARLRQVAAQQEQTLRLATEQAQHETIATHRRLTQLLETMSDAFVEVDADWRITYQNAAAERINGNQPRSQVVGQILWTVWPAAVGSIIETQYRHAMATQTPVHFEARYDDPPTFDGWLEIDAYPARDHLSLFYRDITARKQIEEALREREQQLQQQLAEIEVIYQTAPIGLNVLDTDLRFLRINERLAEMNGLPIAAHLGRTVREVLPTIADTAEQILGPILATGEPLLNVEITGETPAQPGVQRTWLEHFVPLKHGDRVIGISTVCTEITDRKHLEAERQRTEEILRQAKETLEKRVLERTAELYQRNLALQQSESILRSFFNSDGMLMAIVELQDHHLRYIAVNQALAEFWDTTPNALENAWLTDQDCPSGQNQVWVDYYRAAAASQAPVRFEYCDASRPTPRWLFVNLCPIAISASGYPWFSYIAKDITDRKQVEAALADREEHLRLTLEFTHIGTWDWDVQTGHTLWNENHYRLLGLSPTCGDDLYQQWRQAIHPEDIAGVDGVLQTALAERTDYEAEYRVVYPDGSVHWLVGKGRGIYDAAGQPVRMLGVVLDVSEHKRIEAALQANEARYRAIVQAQVDCIIRFAADDTLLFANEAYWRYCGVTLDAILGTNYAAVIAPADRDRVAQAIATLTAAHPTLTLETRMINQQGGVRWMQWIYRMLFDPQGNMLEYQAVGRDTTELKQAEQALRNSEKRLQLALEASGDGIWDWSITTNEIYYSPQYVQMLGYGPEELADCIETWYQLIHPDDLDWVQQLLAQHFQDQSVPYQFDYRLRARDGHWQWIANYGKVVARNDQGEPLRMIGTHRDISDRKAAEERLATSLQEKEILLKEIHHRVKNNLGIVSSLLQMQMRRTDDQLAQAILRDSQNRIASIALVHEKLYRSDDLADIDFAQYLQDLIVYLFDSYTVNSQQVRLVVQVEKINLDIEMAIPCGLIVNELVSNALKHAFPDNRTGCIKVHLNCLDPTLSTGALAPFSLTVQDDGIGLPANVDPKQTMTLGLSLIQGLTDQIRGTIAILPTPIGTTFQVTFTGKVS